MPAARLTAAKAVYIAVQSSADIPARSPRCAAFHCTAARACCRAPWAVSTT